MNKFAFLVALVFLFQNGISQKETVLNLQPYFDKYGVEGCFVLFNQSENEFILYNTRRCDSGFIPASTFKIPHSLIALEEGIIKDTSQVIKWDGHVWPIANWNGDQTLKTAVRYSCVWVYTGFTEQIPAETYQKYVNAFDYGNKDLTGQPTRFWLAGLLRISANQQISFLRKFYNYELPVSQRSVDILKDILVLETNGSSSFSGKTGGGMISDSEYVMWLVGYIVKDDNPYFYAMNFTTDDFPGLSQARLKIVRDILHDLNIYP